jgi:cytochrome c peroxidase
MTRSLLVAIVAAHAALSGCSAGGDRPWAPDDNQITADKAELGRYLFHDERLSINGTTSCASCHDQQLAFSDGEVVSTGATGDVGARNSPQLANVAWLRAFTWSNPLLTTLERQIPVPLFGEAPLEMGLANHMPAVLDQLRQVPRYQQLFIAAFPDDADPYTSDNVIWSLATFLRTLESREAPYDRYRDGDEGALEPAQQRGRELFFSERLGCGGCHSGPDLTVASDPNAVDDEMFYNVGLYAPEAYPPGGDGIAELSADSGDMGAFRVPSLRNVAISAPYMHDGSVATLDEVIRIFEAGGRVIESGPHAGDGRDDPNNALRAFSLTNAERADLLRFLDSLTDEQFLVDPRFARPADLPRP